MEAKLKQFLVDEFGITFEQACALSPEEKEVLFDKCSEIELDEAYKSDPISERGALAAAWQNIMMTKA